MREPATTTPVQQPSAPSRWSVYMVRTATGLLYTGISTDPLRRLRQHQSGKGARALRGKGPLTLAWQQEVGEKGRLCASNIASSSSRNPSRSS